MAYTRHAPATGATWRPDQDDGGEMADAPLTTLFNRTPLVGVLFRGT